MKFSSSLFLSTLSVLVVASTAESTVRGSSGINSFNNGIAAEEADNPKGRRLQFGGIFGGESGGFGGLFGQTLDMDQIMEAFMPMITELLQSILSTELEQTMITNNVTQELAGIELAPGCTGDVAVSYILGELQGLDSFEIESVELVPGTESLDLSFLGLNGASWSGVWNIVGTFAENIGLDTEAQVSAEACGSVLNATSFGSILAENAGFEFQLGMGGSSPSIFDIAESFTESLTVSNAAFSFDSILDDIDGTFGGDSSTEFDLTTMLDGLFTEELTEQVSPAVTELLEGALSGGLQVGK